VGVVLVIDDAIALTGRRFSSVAAAAAAAGNLAECADPTPG